MNKKLIIALSSILGLGTAIALAISGKPQEDSSLNEVIVPLPQVSVLSVATGSHEIDIHSFGEIRPQYELSVQSPLQGIVESIDPQFVSGAILRSGSTLLTLDDTQYKQALADAQRALADARVALLTEQRESRQARAEWEYSKLPGEPESPLVLRKPQLEAAKAQVSQAENQVAQAELDLSRTCVTTPFNAIVVDRKVSPGSYLQPGSAISTLYSTDRFEVRLPLPDMDWALLPDEPTMVGQRWAVTLFSEDRSNQWQGFVSRVEHHLDNSIRQRSLVVTVDNPLQQDTPLLPGTFVSAFLSSRTVEGLWQLPASSLTRSGHVWYVDNEQRLQRQQVIPLYKNDDALFVQPFLDNLYIQVLTHPLNSYVPGLKVAPKAESES